ncbi:hypothetical protein CVT25_014863 [Psilocybe cyanescens]|uniref:Protein kinase domain-containing protein n=1 Tax=Psilocybe cyanescens TaxID=93625 RepID=A0A409WEX4_PSICY|nr:hypothetical protein CVT25_014863 [Psilocybe cyanescens]
MADTTSPEQTVKTGTITPPRNSSTQPLMSGGTPLAGKRSGVVALSSTEYDRQTNFESFRRDITGKIIGPMLANDFLAKFIPSTSGSASFPPADGLDKIKAATKETDMYEPFIALFKNYLTTGEKFADSHTSTLTQWEGKSISPDVVLVDDVSKWNLRLPAKSTAFHDRPIESVGVMLEFKLDAKVSDPFTDESDAVSFEIISKDSKDPKGQTLGQICAYATAHMANHFRSHVFSVLVFREYARILRWDRAGVVVTEKINFTSDAAQPLAEFFRRYACASSEGRGQDSNTTSVDPLLLSSDVKKELDKTSNGPFYKFKFPASGPSQPKDKFYIAAVPHFMATASPTGRSTRTFKAYDEETEEYVFLKDTWRIIASSLKPEHESYAALAAAGVHHIPTVAAYHDMDDQVTQTSLTLKPDTKRGDLANTFRKFQHYRLVLKEFAKPLEEFKDVKELLTAFSDAIQAHSEAHDQAQILHRDISVGNIMIDGHGRGLLVDWDLSKSTTQKNEGPSLPERTGTWQFIAYNLGRKRQPNEPMPIHNKDDDLESFFYVLYWVALRRCEHVGSINEIRNVLDHVYDTSIKNPTEFIAPPARLHAMKNDQLISDGHFASPALNAFSTAFLRIVNKRYFLSPAQRSLLLSWKDDALKKRNGDAANEEISPELLGAISPELMLQMQAYNRKPGREFPVFDPYYFLKSLQPKWAPDLFMELFGPDETVDWVTGSTNVNRDSLLTRAQSSLNKRKPDSQHTTVSGSNDGNDDGNPRNKKPRMDSAHLYTHHEEDASAA